MNQYYLTYYRHEFSAPSTKVIEFEGPVTAQKIEGIREDLEYYGAEGAVVIGLIKLEEATK